MNLEVERTVLKKALDTVSLAIRTKEGSNNIEGHAVFIVQPGFIKLFSTDKNRIAYAFVPAVGDEEGSFTADPKKLSTALTKSEGTRIKLSFDQESMTLKVIFGARSQLSFPSLNPDKFVHFEESVDKAVALKTLNAGVFLDGLRFIKGFLPKEENDRKFSRIYISKEVMYGSDGLHKIGAYSSPQFEGLDDLVIPQIAVSSAVSMIDREDITDLTLKTTSQFILMYSEDEKHMFGFLKTTGKMPRLPISLKKPETHCFRVSPDKWSKRLQRLSIAAGTQGLGINMKLSGNELEMVTTNERPSRDTMDCNRIWGKEDIDFCIEYRVIKELLGLFRANDLLTYVEDTHCTFRLDAKLEMKSGDISIPFTAVGLMSLARVVKK